LWEADFLRCEICGREVSEKGAMIEVDGAKLLACAQCRKFGEESKQRFGQPRKTQPFVPSTRTGQSRVPASQIPARIPRKITKKVPEPKFIREKREKAESSEYELVDDYPQRIKRAREDLGFTQSELANKVGEKLSIIQKLETGKMRPSDVLIDKLDRLLRITLKALVEDDLIPHDFEKSDVELTIGDIAKQVTKKKES
jgi:putative transcription factor